MEMDQYDAWYIVKIKGILCHFLIFTLEEIFILNKYHKILHAKTLHNLCVATDFNK